MIFGQPVHATSAHQIGSAITYIGQPEPVVPGQGGYQSCCRAPQVWIDFTLTKDQAIGGLKALAQRGRRILSRELRGHLSRDRLDRLLTGPFTALMTTNAIGHDQEEAQAIW